MRDGASRSHQPPAATGLRFLLSLESVTAPSVRGEEGADTNCGKMGIKCLNSGEEG